MTVNSGTSIEYYYYIFNLQGDVIGIVNQSGQKVVEYTYDAWGNILSITGTQASSIGEKNPIRYRGYYYDNESGFYYLGSRYYDPEIGRFISPDLIDVVLVSPTSFKEKNLYAYCNNNPIVYKDVTGAIAETAFDVATLALSAIEVTMNPTDLSAWASLLGDTVDLIPFVTGVGETIKALRASSKVAEGTAEAIDTYSNLKKINKGLGNEVHHIIEKRFAKSLEINDTNKMLGIALDKDTHRIYTNKWRRALEYGKIYDKNAIVKAAAKVYSDNPRLMGALIQSMTK